MRAIQNTARLGLFGIIAGFIAVAASAQTASAASAYYPAYYPYQVYTQSYPAYPVTYTASATNVQALIGQINALLAQLRQLQELQVQLGYGSTHYTYTHTSGHDYDVEVDTDDAFDIDGDEATFSGDIDLNDASYATVWFEYGQDGSLTKESDTDRVTSNGSFDIDVDDLDEDERYYYRAVAEDPGGYVTYGSIESFVSDQGQDDDDDDNDHDGDEPDVDTEDAEHITDDSAEIHGSVDMNDFEDGTVFFVYGEDEDAVEDVEDEDSYNDVDEDGDDLQKVKVFSGLDDSRSFWTDIFGLDDDTDYFFRICVGYEDDDDDDTLSCGDVESFTTDN